MFRLPKPGELATVGVLDFRVQHIAGPDGVSLCGRWSAERMWPSAGRTVPITAPVCKKCQQARE